MRATALQTNNFTHRVVVRDHQVTVDEPTAKGGKDQGPTPQELLAASLASCAAVTMEMYAARKGWKVDGIAVDCDYVPGGRGAPTRFQLTLRLPSDLSPEQHQMLRTVAAKCPVHRTLDGEVMFDERLELIG
jgi:putative redox protein